MPEEEIKKKKGSQLISEAAENYANTVESSTGSLADAQQTAGEQFIEEVNAAINQNNMARAAARSVLEQGLQNGLSGVDAIIAQYNDQLAKAQQQAGAEYAASQKAAQGAGLTHLAASIANLIGVGGFNASNQTYTNPSLDWMRKADQDRQIAKNRMDNLRDRQRAIQQQRIQMEINANNQLAGFDADTANQNLGLARDIAAARRETAVGVANTRAQGAINAGQARMQGASAVASAQNQEASLAQRAQEHNDSVNLQLATHGLKRNADGSFGLDPNAEINKLNSAARSGGSGGSKNTYYYTDPNGNLIPVYMTASEYDKFVEQSYATLKDDPEFQKAYNTARAYSSSDLDRKSLIFNYATMNDDRRRVLSQYGPAPEGRGTLGTAAPEGAQRQGPMASGYGMMRQPTEVRLVNGKYVTVDNTDTTGGGVSEGGYKDSTSFMDYVRGLNK